MKNLNLPESTNRTASIQRQRTQQKQGQSSTRIHLIIKTCAKDIVVYLADFGSMKNLNPRAENRRRNGVIGMGLVPDHNKPATINVKVCRGVHQYDVAVPPNSSFGYLKSIAAQEIGVSPEKLKLIFEGDVKNDGENFQTAGVVNNSEVVIMEDSPSSQETSEEVHQTSEISKGSEAVAEIRKEVDNFSQQVSSLQAAVDAGTRVDDKNIIYLSEMLMRQLLKLDEVEADGEGRFQRRAEVRRIQSLLETLDVLKSKNSNISNNAKRSVPTTTPETCNSIHEMSPSTPKPASEAHHETPKPVNAAHPIASPPSQIHSFPHHTYPLPNNDAVPHYASSHAPHFPSYTVPHYTPNAEPNYASFHVPAYYPCVDPSPYVHSGVSYYVPSHTSYYAASPAPAFNPFLSTTSSDSPESCYGSMPSTKVTQNWEHFS